MKLVPVDHDPFGQQPAAPSAAPRLVPVDHDPFATAVNEAPPERGWGETFVDRGLGIGAAGLDILGGAVDFVNQVGADAPRFEFADAFADVARGYATRARGSQSAMEQSLQQGLGAAMESQEGFTDQAFAVGEYLAENPAALGQVFDSLVPSMAAGGAPVKIARALGVTSVPALTGIGIGGQSAVGGIMSGQGAADAVGDPRALQAILQSPEYEEAMLVAEGDHGKAMAYLEARAREAGAGTGFLANLALLGAGQKLGLNVIEDAIVGAAPKAGSRLVGAALGGAKETVGEGLQGGVDQVAQNVGEQVGGLPTELTADLGGAMLLEALAGGPAGALTGATNMRDADVAPGVPPKPAPQQAPQPENVSSDVAPDDAETAAPDLGAMMTPELAAVIVDALETAPEGEADTEAAALAEALGAVMLQGQPQPQPDAPPMVPPPAAPDAAPAPQQKQSGAAATSVEPASVASVPEPERTDAIDAVSGPAQVSGSESTQTDANSRKPTRGAAPASGVSGVSDAPSDILTTPRKKYIADRIKAEKVKKGSPGYDDAVRRIEGQYERDLDAAEAALPFEEFNARNSGSPESVNRQAWEVLRRESGLREQVAELAKEYPNAPTVEVVRDESALPERLRGTASVAQRGDGNNVGPTEGVYDPESDTLYLLSENLAPERVRWVTDHEIAGHVGLRGAIARRGGDLDGELSKARENTHIAALADAIADDRGGDLDPLTAAEEALAELQAARVAKDWDAIEGRYGVRVPHAMREGVRAAVARFVEAVKRMLGGANSYSDAEVRTLLSDAYRYVKEGPAAKREGKPVASVAPKYEAPMGDGSTFGGQRAPRLKPRDVNDLRDFDFVPKGAKQGVVAKAVADLRESLDAFRKLFTGRPKNPRTILQRLNGVRARIFDSAMSQARAIEGRNPDSKALRKLFNQVMAAPGDSRLVSETVNDAIASRFAVFTNRARNILGNNGLEKMTDQQNAQLRRAMLGIDANVPANIAAAAKSLRKLMDTLHADMIAAGVDVGVVEDVGYLTRMYDDAKILDDEDGFLKSAREQYRNHEFAIEVGKDARGIVYEPDRLALFLSFARRSTDPGVQSALATLKDRLKKYRNGGDLEDVRAIEGDIAAMYDQVRGEYADRRAAAWLHRIKTPNTQDFRNQFNPTAAPLTRERSLSGAADSVMADWMKTDMLDILDTFARKASEKTEHALRFGPNGERIQELIDQASREGVPKPDLEDALRIVAGVTGHGSTISGSAKSALDALHTWTYLALLSKATISSLAEGVTFAMRTGDARQIAAPLVMAGRAITRSKRRAELERLALAMGVNGNRAVEDILMNRLGGDHTMTPQWSRLLTKFFRATYLSTLTEAQRAYGVGVATGYLRTLSKQIVKARSLRGNSSARVEVGDASNLLNELGIADHEAFADWMLSQGALPNTSELFDENGRPTIIGNDYMTAVRRFVDQTIQKPGREHRPVWTNTEFGRIATGIMSFSYAQYANVLKRQAMLIKRRGLTADDAKFAVGALGLVAAQTIVSTIREMLFNADRFEDKDDEEVAEEMLALGFTRSFGFGSGDPLIQYLTGLKYQRSLAETAVGAGPGLLFQGIDRVGELVTDRNSENTDTTEYRAAQSVYRMLAVPAINAALSRLPYIGGPAIMELSDKEYANAFAEQFARKPEPRTRLGDLYREVNDELEAVQEHIETRIAALPREQWAGELERLREEYPGILAGATLDVYADNAQNRRQGRVGSPKGKTPKIKPTENGGSVLGELEGYSYWRTVGGRAKEFTTPGIKDRIENLSGEIRSITREPGALTYEKLATYAQSSDAADSIRERITASPKLAGREASKSEINTVLDELRAQRNELRRQAVDVTRRGIRGERIERSSETR